MLLFLDDYHLGDPLFLSGLAQDIARARRPALLLHSGREAAAKALEAQGIFDPDVVIGGELGAHAAVVERAVRDENRIIAAALTEAGAATVRLLASDRSLVQPAKIDVELGNTDWIATLLRQRACVVLGALEATESTTRLLDPAELAARLSEALGTPLVVLTTSRTPGVLVDGQTVEAIGIETLADRREIPARDVAQQAHWRGARVVITSRTGAFDPRGARGTKLSS
ncbi:MAG: hypothetical protein AAF624_06615 [Bacteroidota bacterium]